MSNTHSTGHQEVLARWPEVPINREEVIALIHGLQVDLPSWPPGWRENLIRRCICAESRPWRI